MGNGIYRPIPFTCARVVSFHLNWGRCCVWWNSFIFELMMIFVLPVRGVCTVHYTSCNHSPHRHSASTTRPSPTLYFFCLLHFCYGLFFSVPENWQNSSPENSITAEGGKLCRFLVVFFFQFRYRCRPFIWTTYFVASFAMALFYYRKISVWISHFRTIIW